ncbi:MAG: flagellar hook-basal body complex protein FliE [Planctomycetaceae bacterium]
MSAISGISAQPLGSSPSLGLQKSIGPGSQTTSGPSFQDLLHDSISQMQQIESQANLSVEQSLLGGDITQVEALTAVKKADMALKMMVQVRNKLLEAYDEIKQMRM